ncbi:hypothetical protein ZIOFF_056879 [Zingiber officinale]|uniref:NAD(P)H-hydrate epimerase n=1 Tax=Zingiber officinale TaxID=94328 RepID=A0A8J5KPU3_ZINOF|nr:hypothetical protein ZIOFF_056879 [Zingiber officinale]
MLMKLNAVVVVSIDIPSGWHVEEGDITSEGREPDMLVSSTAHKLCAKKFDGPHHFLGGRFVPPSINEKENYTSPELLEDQLLADPIEQGQPSHFMIGFSIGLG